MARLAAALEIGLAWLLAVVAGVVLAGALLAQAQASQLAALREGRVYLLLDGLRERLETDLSLGLDLADHPRTQQMIEAALGRQTGLRVLELVAADGRTLFSTDRAAIGESLPPAALGVARAAVELGQRQWRKFDGVDHVLGVPVVDAAGQPAGHLVALQVPVADPLGRPFAWATFVVAAVVALLGLALLWWNAVPALPRAAWVRAEARLVVAEKRIGLLLAEVTREERS